MNKMTIEYPYINGYCEKCVNNDGDTENLCCKKLKYANCGAVIECGSFFREINESLSATFQSQMEAFFELQKKRTEKMEKEACEALAYIFTKYGGDPVSPDLIHDLILSVSILHSYGYWKPQQIHELMYKLDNKIKF